ncbi:MAG: hypothetical protein NWE89_02955 [Candidatus Bathyarchaeota archaeon]|nr:hypothetical protein [Candidatus Bathyarchaeota archaeon]
MSVLSKLGKIDYRWLYITSLILTAIPLVYPIGLSVTLSQPVKDYYSAIQDLPEGSVIAVSFGGSASLLDEQEAQFLATWKTIFSLGHKVLFYSTTEDGPMILQDHLGDKVKPEDYGYTYGEDYVELGFSPLGEPGEASFAANIRGVYAADKYGTPLDDLPMMVDINDYSGIDLLMFQYTACTSIEWVVRQWSVPYQTKVIATTLGCCGPMAAPYYPSQIEGFLSGSGAGTELEVLSGNPGPGAAMSDSKSIGILPQLVFIAFGNIAYFANKYMKKEDDQ